VADKTKRKKAKRPPLEDVDREITALFQRWLVGFEKTQSAKDDEESAALWPRGEAWAQRFMHEYADAASELAASAYADLMRLTGYDPAAEILAKLR
jgi:hypothetical protein